MYSRRVCGKQGKRGISPTVLARDSLPSSLRPHPLARLLSFSPLSQWASWTWSRMLKIPQILIFLAALLSLGGGHPLISGGGVIRSQKSGFKWRPFNSVDENPRRISPFVAALAENSAPHPAILHGNGFVSFGGLEFSCTKKEKSHLGIQQFSGSRGLGQIRVWHQELT